MARVGCDGACGVAEAVGAGGVVGTADADEADMVGIVGIWPSDGIAGAVGMLGIEAVAAGFGMFIPVFVGFMPFIPPGFEPNPAEAPICCALATGFMLNPGFALGVVEPVLGAMFEGGVGIAPANKSFKALSIS